MDVTAEGTPILLRDLATIQVGPEMRRAVAELDGQGEVTGGNIVMRNDVEKLRELPLVTPTGAQVPLGQIAAVEIVDGPPMLRSEDARINGWTFVDIRGVDLGSYVAQAQQVVRDRVQLPPGYSISWSGQYEYMLRAKDRLTQVIPFTLIIIFALLYLTFSRMGEALLVMLSLPFAQAQSTADPDSAVP